MNNYSSQLANSTKNTPCLIKLVFLATILPTLYACANSPEILNTKVLHQSPHCGINEAGIKMLTQDEELKQIINHGLRPPTKTSPAVDYKHQYIISVSMGLKPTSGYYLSLETEKAQLNDESIIIEIGSNQPGEGSMNAQMMTSPCLILSVDKGEYSKIVAPPYSLSLP